MPDDDLLVRLKRSGTNLAKLEKQAAEARKQAESALRASRPRVEPIKPETSGKPKKPQK
jgi:lambda repressor-like predicted transcriptional regulator